MPTILSARITLAMMNDRGMIEGAMAEFYRQQVERLKRLAQAVTSPGARLELLEIAAQFQKLAEFSVSIAANSNTAATGRDSKSA